MDRCEAKSLAQLSLAFDLHKYVDVLKVKHGLEGQTLDSRGRIRIGNRAGPKNEFSNFVHELAHFAELPIKRVAARPATGWGLWYGDLVQVFQGREYQEPLTDAGVKREGRVWAIQANIMEELGYEVDVRELVRSATFLASWTYWAHPFNFKKDPALDALASWVENKRSRYPLPKIKARILRRVEALRSCPQESFAV